MDHCHIFKRSHQFLHIQGSQQTQTSSFISAAVFAVTQQAKLRHGSFPNRWLKWCNMLYKFLPYQPFHE
jgi:hypothetical protein